MTGWVAILFIVICVMGALLPHALPGLLGRWADHTARKVAAASAPSTQEDHDA